MKTEHSPLPWVVNKWDIILAKDDNEVCECGDFESSVNTANADLIIKAVNNFHALVEVSKLLCDCAESEDLNMLEEIVEKARAALKALEEA